MAQSEAETARLARSGSTPSDGVTYNNNQYKITDLQYPVDLSASEEYGGHKVLFLINVNTSSKLIRKENNGNLAYGSLPVIDIPASELRNRTAVESGISGVANVANKTLKAAYDKYNQETGSKKEPPQFNIAAPYKRLLSAISLYVPTDLNITYGVSWGEEDLTTSETIGTILGAALGTNDRSGSPNSVSEWAGGIANASGSVIARNVLSLSGGLQKATKTTPGNAKAEQLFQGVDFRTFNFNYDFAPRSEYEAENVLRIIRMFRHHMLPEFAESNQFLYTYPSEFEIKYFKGDQENPYLEKHFTAVLTNCSINYTPDGQFSTFANGMPSRIRMNLTFKELSKPTKETSYFDRSGT